MELVSDLPDDVVRDCLIRVSYDQFPTIASVCKDWMVEVQLPEFHRVRRAAGRAQKLFVMAQSTAQPDRSLGLAAKCSVHPVHRLALHEPDTGDWRELLLPEGMSDGLPMFCRLAGVGSFLVVMGGWDPVTWKVSNSVFVYNFLSATWRRGVDMPGGPRTFFGCASDCDSGIVYVAGGHDNNKTALRSAMAYDVAKDEWVVLPNMARERDECKAIFHAGKLRVIGGYCTDMQGRFERSAEVFDVGAGQWSRVEEDYLEAGRCPRTCVDVDDGEVYMCRGSDVVASREGGKWEAVAKLPAEVCNKAFTATWGRKLLVMGSAGFGQSYVAYMLDLRRKTWTKLETPWKYSGHVQSGCYLEI
jgi:hypothetical protein